MPRLAVLATVSLLLAAALAGCGGSSGTSGTTSAPATTTQTPAQQKAEIKANWQEFFAGKTPPGRKAALLEDGPQFLQAIKAQAASPLAQSSGAKVTSVTLTDAGQATVVYTITLGGQPALKGQHGTATYHDGVWQVGKQSFCQLLALQGAVPAACKG